MKIAVVGSRDFPDLHLVEDLINSIPMLDIAGEPNSIISGGAKGVDSAAENCAKNAGFYVKSIRPDWKKYGRGAGIIRNQTIIEEADVVFAFWDGESRGTKNSIDTAFKLNKKCTIIYPEERKED